MVSHSLEMASFVFAPEPLAQQSVHVDEPGLNILVILECEAVQVEEFVDVLDAGAHVPVTPSTVLLHLHVLVLQEFLYRRKLELVVLTVVLNHFFRYRHQGLIGGVLVRALHQMQVRPDAEKIRHVFRGYFSALKAIFELIKEDFADV